MSKKLNQLRWYLKSQKIEYKDEYRFSRETVGNEKGVRQRLKDAGLKDWKFDLAIPSKKIAVEYEGLMSNKSRHTTPTGYTGDLRKYNAATKLGWKVLRYSVINIHEAIKDVEYLVKI